MNDIVEKARLAAQIIQQADGLLITAGAGMGVDSGLPDFRGNDGLWKAYPALKQANLSFTKIANPQAFADTPELAWGFYGHRLQLYRDTVPHTGFEILRHWTENKARGAFIFTSNVDGQFQKAGFDEARIAECHGSIHHLQCSEPCNSMIRPAHALAVNVDEEQCLYRSALPRCPQCGALLRPNILMFDDYAWLSSRTDYQIERMREWLSCVDNLAIIEIGAGSAIPTVRNVGEQLQQPIIRINPRDYQVRNRRCVGLPVSALEGLNMIASHL